MNDFEGSTQNWIVGYGSESGIVYPYATSGWSGASYSLDSIEQDGKVIYKAAPASVKDIAPDFVGDNKKYSLDGRRVSDDVRGLYISNGKVCFKK